ncbi:MAG: DUF1295 domain-containing protein [Promethearchaeati archaeon]
MEEKKNGFLVIIITYSLALGISLITATIFNFLHPILIVLIADLIGTMVVYLISTFYDNASLYDPYWSVAPIIIAFYFFIRNPLEGVLTLKIILLSFTCIWGFRLTWNWASHWKGLTHEDWRYRMYRESNVDMFWLINLFGIQLMPTIIVYLGCLSFLPALCNTISSFNIIDVVAIFITGGAIIIESVADKQLRNFINTRESYQKIMKEGLWKYSRHPNYFGEITFWWGLYLFGLGSNIFFWWTIIGPIVITALFNFVSIPLMDERNLNRRPNYKEYMDKTSKLIFWSQKE